MVKTCENCEKVVSAKGKTICCDLCNKWIYIQCNGLNHAEFEYLEPVLRPVSASVTSAVNSRFVMMIFQVLKITQNCPTLAVTFIFLSHLNSLTYDELNENENLPDFKYRNVSYSCNFSKHRLKLNYFRSFIWVGLR